MLNFVEKIKTIILILSTEPSFWASIVILGVVLWLAVTSN
jgi:hypothetical protein